MHNIGASAKILIYSDKSVEILIDKTSELKTSAHQYHLISEVSVLVSALLWKQINANILIVV